MVGRRRWETPETKYDEKLTGLRRSVRRFELDLIKYKVGGRDKRLLVCFGLFCFRWDCEVLSNSTHNYYFLFLITYDTTIIHPPPILINMKCFLISNLIYSLRFDVLFYVTS